MLSNIYAKVVPLLEEKQFNIDIDSFLNFLGKYKSKEFIYPSALHRRLKVDIKTIYEILEICVQEGVLEQWLEIYCPNCSRFTGQWFKNIEDIPEQVNCFNCGEDIENPLKHAVVIYRVL